MPVSPLSRSGARLAVPMTERPRQAARPLHAPIPTCDAKHTAPGSSRTPATSPPHHLLLSPSVTLALRAASGPPGPVSPFAGHGFLCWLRMPVTQRTADRAAGDVPPPRASRLQLRPRVAATATRVHLDLSSLKQIRVRPCALENDFVACQFVNE